MHNKVNLTGMLCNALWWHGRLISTITPGVLHVLVNYSKFDGCCLDFEVWGSKENNLRWEYRHQPASCWCSLLVMMRISTKSELSDSARLWDRTWMSQLVAYRFFGRILESSIDSWSVFIYCFCIFPVPITKLATFSGFTAPCFDHLLYIRPPIVHSSASSTTLSAFFHGELLMYRYSLWFTCSLWLAHQCFFYTRIRLITERWNRQV
jgi:hypothetical protein